ncbi:hypothetical protein [Caenispirillum bisanense]|uniref:Glycosyltransferase RgtA/B/C/D-like domain-containing protein n=1 Tax=Caenispirillum bisanense TaxID=414052 RepID=A0A286GT54_9PROT|nr:hypothetical protein [Caenispirillum bisanense]SOD98725.1 hypothetical protein SAMN05421508_10864 [Caenispirillum bisanense]
MPPFLQHWPARLSSALPALLFAAAAIWSLVVLVGWIGGPILDMFGFRQTQTAISSAYMLKDGLALRYQTPVLGAPWSIPFEFPTYQILTAILAMAGLSVDVAGRIVSYVFFLGCLHPIATLCRHAGIGREGFLVTGALFLSSPLYVFWSRTVMIESAALFFALVWLALLLDLLAADRPARRPVASWALCLTAGVLAVLTKSTTFPAFCVAGCLLVLGAVLRDVPDLRRPTVADLRGGVTRLTVAVGACLLPIALGYVWVLYSDQVKAENPFGALLTSAALAKWNFGTLDQRVSAALWSDVVLGRAVPQVLGAAAWIAPLVLGAGLVLRRVSWPLAVFAAAFAVPFAVFTNLHMVHGYYQYANGLFLVLAVGIAVAAIGQQRSRIAALALLALFLAGNAWTFRTIFYPPMTANWSASEVVRIGEKVQALVPEDAGIVVLGQDWSSEVPYYSDRRALAVAAWFPPELAQAALADPDAALGEAAFGGVVACGASDLYPPALRPMIESFKAGRRVLATAGGCRLLSPEQDPAAGGANRLQVTELLAAARVERADVPVGPVPEGFFAHPSSRLVASAPAGERLDGLYGFLDKVWAEGGNPPPVTFTLTARTADGSDMQLLARTLDPAAGEAARLPQTFSVEVPGVAGTTTELVFETAISGTDNSWGWTYWGNAW